MSYNGSGTFNINTSGQPVVTGTVISSTAFNALTSDLGTGLSTAITKDGQTTATARIPFAAGINSSLVTDATSTTTGSIITAGGVGIAKALYVGTTLNVAGASTLAAITGTFNGTVGATTPSTGAFTTVTTTTSVAVGGSTLSGSGSGVQFPATQSASTDVNTLDDYEEGTWTPTLTFGGVAHNGTYSYQSAHYTKVGRLVTVTGIVGINSAGTATGTARMTSLPFTAINQTGNAEVMGLFSGFTGLTGTALFGDGPTNNTTVTFYTSTGTITAVDKTNFNTGGANNLEFTFSYFST
jgi:hypothetical protein